MKARRYASWGRLAVGAALMLLVWALLVWVASRPALKSLIDLTPQRINSVDPVTVELLQQLRSERAEVQFHLFVPPTPGEGLDDRARQALALRARVQDLTQTLLRSYAYLGGEAVTVIRHDFYSVDQRELREAAQRFDYKHAENEVLVVAVRRLGKEWRHRKLSLITDLSVLDVPQTPMAANRSMPVLKDFKGEEAISSALKSLLVQGTPVAYVLRDGANAPGADLGSGTMNGYDALFLALQQSGFEVRPLSFRETPAVPPDASLVLVLEPRGDLLGRDSEALFAFVKRGGRLVLNYSWNSPDPTTNPDGGRLGELLGFQLSAQPVFHLIHDVNGRTGGRGLSGDLAVSKLLLQYSMHPAMRRLAEARRWVEMTNALQVDEPPSAPTGMRREALLATGEHAWLARPGPDGYPSYHAPQSEQDLHRRVVAMAIEVDATAAASGATAAPPGIAVVFGGVFANNMGMQAGFGDLMLNVCNWLVERRELLDIKGSRYQATHVSLLPQQLTRIYWFAVAGVPGVFLVLGLVVVMLRRRQ